jgi:hypothetical protein
VEVEVESTKLGEKTQTPYQLLTEQATHAQTRRVLKIKITIPRCHPRQIHVRHRMQETLKEPCELVISQMQALSWASTMKTRLCVVSKLHPHVGDTTNPSTPPG